MAFGGGLGIKPIFVSVVDIIALHSIAINNSWYTLVLLARRTCTTSKLQLDCERGTHAGSKTKYYYIRDPQNAKVELIERLMWSSYHIIGVTTRVESTPLV